MFEFRISGDQKRPRGVRCLPWKNRVFQKYQGIDYERVFFRMFMLLALTVDAAILVTKF